MMNYDNFLKSILSNDPNQDLSASLQSLWWDKKGDWEKSHDIAQDIPSNEGFWIHAYLHRKEGDILNADYWYAKAGKVRPYQSLDKEWELLVKHILTNSGLH